MAKRLPIRRGGYTLLELLLYIAIFSIVIGGITATSALITGARIKNQVIAELDYQGEAAVSLLTQALRNATAVNAPAAGNSSAILSLNTVIMANNPTVFDAVTDGAATRLRFTDNSGPGTTQHFLTNSHIDVSGLSFSNVAVAGSLDSIKVQFTLSYKNPSGRAEYDYQRTFYGAATKR